MDAVSGLFSSESNLGGGFFVPGRDYEHFDYVKSEWMAVTALLFLWLTTLVTRQVATFIERRANRELPETESLLGNRQLGDRAGRWAPRFDRAADALRHALLMLLAATVFASIPLPYACKVDAPGGPGFPIPPSGSCMTCLSNGTTLGTSIISWVFFALSVLWVVMELAVADPTSAALARTVVGVTGFPLILAIFVVCFKEWAKIEARDFGCE